MLDTSWDGADAFRFRFTFAVRWNDSGDVFTDLMLFRKIGAVFCAMSIFSNEHEIREGQCLGFS